MTIPATGTLLVDSMHIVLLWYCMCLCIMPIPATWTLPIYSTHVVVLCSLIHINCHHLIDSLMGLTPLKESPLRILGDHESSSLYKGLTNFEAVAKKSFFNHFQIFFGFNCDYLNKQNPHTFPLGISTMMTNFTFFWYF